MEECLPKRRLANDRTAISGFATTSQAFSSRIRLLSRGFRRVSYLRAERVHRGHEFQLIRHNVICDVRILPYGSVFNDLQWIRVAQDIRHYDSRLDRLCSQYQL